MEQQNTFHETEIATSAESTLQKKNPKKFPLIIAVISLLTLVGVGAYTLGVSKSGTKVPANTLVTSLSKTQKSTLFFQRENKVYQLSFPDMSVTVFLELKGVQGTYAFSPDHKKVAYINGYGDEWDNNIYVLNRETNTTKKIVSNERTNRSLSWSKNGAYIMVGSGTGPEGMLTVYELSTGKEQISVGSSYFVWIDDVSAVKTIRESVEPLRPWGSGMGNGLEKINIATGKSKILMKPDALTDYSVIKYENDCLYYSKQTVATSADWLDENKVVKTNYCLTIDTNETKPASESEVEIAYSLVQKKVLELFPQFKGKLYNAVNSPHDKNIIAIEVNNGTSIYDADIYLLDLNNPEASLKKLDKGTNIDWLVLD